MTQPRSHEPTEGPRPLAAAAAGGIVDVLCDAFRDYPVMRYVLGEAADYDARLRVLVDLFVHARVHRDEPMLGIDDGSGRLVAAAIVSRSWDDRQPEALVAHRERTWRALGTDAAARYGAFGDATRRFAIAEPHHHLNMIGVRRSHRGRGLAGTLLRAVHELARADGRSRGVSLTTEDAANLGLYRHFGYRVVGHARVGEGLETWTLYRPEGA